MGFPSRKDFSVGRWRRSRRCGGFAWPRRCRFCLNRYLDELAYVKLADQDDQSRIVGTEQAAASRRGDRDPLQPPGCGADRLGGVPDGDLRSAAIPSAHGSLAVPGPQPAGVRKRPDASGRIDQQDRSSTASGHTDRSGLDMDSPRRTGPRDLPATGGKHRQRTGKRSWPWPVGWGIRLWKMLCTGELYRPAA